MGTLTIAQIRKAGPGRHGDGAGLYMVIMPTGSKQWVQRITIDGKRTDKGLGGFPAVSISEARKEAEANRVAVKAGRNPFLMPRRERDRKEAQEDAKPTAPTFGQAAQEEFRRRFGQEPESATARRWWSRLKIHVLPVIGETPVTDITRARVAEIVNGLRETNFETARKVKQEMSGVFLYSVAIGYRRDDPADRATNVLMRRIKAKVEPRPALEHSQVAKAIQKIRNGEGKRATRLCFELLILTGVRSAECRNARWSEIDLDAATWTIPAERMKARRDHVIPLSQQAITLLVAARNLWITNDPDDSDIGWPVEIPADGLIFPHPFSGKRLSENSLSDRAKKDFLGCVPHGFRSSFRDWAAESGNYTWEAIELSLAHAIGTSVSQAYFRTHLLDQRKPLMQAWADYVDPDPPIF